MLYFYCTRQKNPNLLQKIKNSAKDRNIRIQEFVNEGQYSLTHCYNVALGLAQEDEIVVLAHDDITLEFGWDEKLKKIFDETDYGIIGVAGTTTLVKSGVWWENRADLAGIVSHEQQANGKVYKYDTKFSERHDFVMPVVCVDGVFIAIKKNRIKKNFNEIITGFHFYDISFCVDNYTSGVKIGVTTGIKIHHKSVGATTNNWHINRHFFLREYEEKLPLILTPPLDILVQSKSVNLNPIDVGVVILTKNKIDYLIDCIISLNEKTSKEINLQIIVGDTGSSEESLEMLNNFAVQTPNVKIVHIPKYNFAKNNNELVKMLDTELLLFCNNDIKLINNALDLMVYHYQRNKKTTGTIGCRLLYQNNRVQHAGIVVYSTNNVVKGASHFGLKSFYSGKTTNEVNVIGCTGAFLLTSKANFNAVGGFDENTVECFEDVILNLDIRVQLNKRNAYIGEAVCYHYESLTRNESEDQHKRIQQDFHNRLLPKIKSYNGQLKEYIVEVNR